MQCPRRFRMRASAPSRAFHHYPQCAWRLDTPAQHDVTRVGGVTRPLDRPFVVGLLLLGLLGGPACGKERAFSSDVAPLEGNGGSSAPGSVANPAADVNAPEGAMEDPTETGAGGSGRCASSANCSSTAAPICDQATGTCTACLSGGDCPSDTPSCKLDPNAPTRNLCVQCLRDADCSGAAPVCDLSTNECTSRCQDSAQCSGATPLCDAVAQVCVQCLATDDCSAPTPACDTATARCVECVAGNECPAGTFCNTEARSCVGCLETSQCLDEFNAHCQTDPALPSPFTCVGCVENRDCATKENLGTICRVDDGKCVECLTDADCTTNPNATACSALGTCGACITDVDCGAIPGRTACLAGAGCVECTSSAQCSGNPRGSLCKTTTTNEPTDTAPLNTCVECTSDTDCTDPDASACQGNQCVPCVFNEDCSHVDSTPGVAGGTALNVCDAGSCVQCTGLQREACGANVCDSLARQCTAFPANSADTCEPCVSDAHCEADARCVEQTFNLQSIGFFCFPLTVGTPGTCEQNMFVTATAAATIDEPTANVCLQRQSTCPARLAYITGVRCLDADDHGPCGGGIDFGGACVLGPPGFACTVPCISSSDCTSDTADCLAGLCQL